MNLTKTSLLIACSNPMQLSKFYSLVSDTCILEGINENHYELRNDSRCRISFYKPCSNRDSNRLIPPSVAICFQREASSDPQLVINNWVKEVVSRGGKLIEGPVLETFGAEAWMSDQEDNKFLIFVPFMSS